MTRAKSDLLSSLSKVDIIVFQSSASFTVPNKPPFDGKATLSLSVCVTVGMRVANKVLDNRSPLR